MAFGYNANLELYPRWQAWPREHTTPTLITWGPGCGCGDPFFREIGARACVRDARDAEPRLFDTGHFALEENLSEIAPLIAMFLERA